MADNEMPQEHSGKQEKECQSHINWYITPMDMRLDIWIVRLGIFFFDDLISSSQNIVLMFVCF
jgi:hypothetical protein